MKVMNMWLKWIIHIVVCIFVCEIIIRGVDLMDVVEECAGQTKRKHCRDRPALLRDNMRGCCSRETRSNPAHIVHLVLGDSRIHIEQPGRSHFSSEVVTRTCRYGKFLPHSASSKTAFHFSTYFSTFTSSKRSFFFRIISHLPSDLL